MTHAPQAKRARVSPADKELTPREFLIKLHQQSGKKSFTKINEYRKAGKRKLNAYVDSRDKDEPLDFDYIQAIPDIAFKTKYEEDEDNPKDEELYEGNELTDWQKPKTEYELAEQEHCVKTGVTLMAHMDHQYHDHNKAKITNRPIDSTTIGPRVSQMDQTHTIISPNILTRYGMGNASLVFQLETDYKTHFTSLIDHCYKTINGDPNYPAKLQEDVVLKFDAGFWNRDEMDAFLVTDQFNQFYLMLHPLVGIRDHEMVDSIDTIIQQSGTVMVSNRYMNDRKEQANYYEFSVFHVDTLLASDDYKYFLLLIFKYTNIEIPTLPSSSKRVTVAPKIVTEPTNNKVLNHYVFCKIPVN
jgi:hypothetical protein